MRYNKKFLWKYRGKTMAEKIVLKKYANRRLYDTDKSKYVTLNDVAERIRNGLQVQVIDAESKEDVTAFILTQIILEEAKGQKFLLPVPLLHTIIQYGDNLLVEFFENYLQQTIDSYLTYKSSVDEQFKKWLAMGLAALSFHLHLLGDIIGAKGPEGYQWPIPYFQPFSNSLQITWEGQWAINAWPNSLC